MSFKRTFEIENVTFEETVDDRVTEVENQMDLVHKEYKLMYETLLSNASTQLEGVFEEVVHAKSKDKLVAMFRKYSGRYW